MKVIVQLSGGKDSLASLIYAINKYGKKNIIAAFCDTKWEHAITYQHIQDSIAHLDVKLVVLSSKKYSSFVDLAKKKKRFPSTKARFCTEELKTKPMIDFILDECKDHLLIIQGIRKDESDARGLMSKQCSYFKFYFEPYKITGKYDKIIKRMREYLTEKANFHETGVLLQEEIESLELINQLPSNRKKHYHSYRKKDIIEWKKQYADDIYRPCFDWTAQEVIDYIIQNGLKPNPLYYMGFSRVGCMPCIMCRHQEIKSMVEFLPDAVERLKAAEQEANSSLFPPDYIPKKYCTGTDANGKKFPTADDVLKYIARNDGQHDLFHEKGEHRCMSFYGICE